MNSDEQLAHLDVVGDEAVVALLRRLYGDEVARYEQHAELLERWDELSGDVFAWEQFAFPVRPEQGAALYVLARAARATSVVEFATSLGFSTVFLATAVRDNGGGTVVSAELVPSKVEAARAAIASVGLDRYVDLRTGDALEVLTGLPEGSVDLLLLDGWPTGETPSIDRQVLDLVTPALRPGALVFDDNAQEDVSERLADRRAGFRSLRGELGGGTVALYDPR